MGPDMGMQALIELPKAPAPPEASGGGNDQILRVRSILHPSMKSVREAHSRGVHHNGSARPVSTGSDSPDFGHDSASLGESINSMFEDMWFSPLSTE